ncbi:MAG: hypothetical protein B6I28_01020 [Fusobacteriia bacterium 4572_132]|nr:MAG: hypothetical protein B6I28_01020 [Fusobacteriia bacterium 4572_132]
MAWEIEKMNDKICLVELDSELEVYNYLEFKDEMNKVIADSYNKIIIVMKNLEYIDSSGLGVLVAILKKIKNEKGKLILTDINEEIFEILSLTSLDKVFKILKTKKDALEEINK